MRRPLQPAGATAWAVIGQQMSVVGCRLVFCRDLTPGSRPLGEVGDVEARTATEQRVDEDRRIQLVDPGGTGHFTHWCGDQRRTSLATAAARCSGAR